jgi:pyridoxal phosphate enzyme (YggS family)
MKNAISERLRFVKTTIAPYKPIIVAVTKYFDETGIEKYYNLGLRDFGENRVQDALAKIEKLSDEVRKNSRFHLIGHLQTNKVKEVVGVFELIHSVDSFKLAKVISNEAQKRGIKQKILLQVNNANEEQKFGFSPDELLDCMSDILKLPNIQTEGLMNIAPLSQDSSYLRNLFRKIRLLKDEIELEHKVQLPHLSMGMSNDYRIALEEGATMIRLGRILFEKL